MRFKALKDFQSNELKSLYVAGLSYTVRPGNDLLAKLVPQWVKDGRVEILGDGVKATVEVKAAGKVG